mgnify:FL=1
MHFVQSFKSERAFGFFVYQYVIFHNNRDIQTNIMKLPGINGFGAVFIKSQNPFYFLPEKESYCFNRYLALIFY